MKYYRAPEDIEKKVHDLRNSAMEAANTYKDEREAWIKEGEANAYTKVELHILPLQPNKTISGYDLFAQLMKSKEKNEWEYYYDVFGNFLGISTKRNSAKYPEMKYVHVNVLYTIQDGEIKEVEG